MEYSKMKRKELIDELRMTKAINLDDFRELNSWLKTRLMEKEMKRLKKTVKKDRWEGVDPKWKFMYKDKTGALWLFTSDSIFNGDTKKLHARPE